MHFVFQLQCIVNGKMFLGIHESNDMWWANPDCKLSDIPDNHDSVIDIGLDLTKPVKEEVKLFGRDRFRVHVISGHATLQEAERIYDRLCDDKFRENPLTYNRTLGRKANKKK